MRLLVNPCNFPFYVDYRFAVVLGLGTWDVADEAKGSGIAETAFALEYIPVHRSSPVEAYANPGKGSHPEELQNRPHGDGRFTADLSCD